MNYVMFFLGCSGGKTKSHRQTRTCLPEGRIGFWKRWENLLRGG